MSEEIVEQPSAESTEQSLEDRIAEKMFGPSEEPEEVAEQEQPEQADEQTEEVKQEVEAKTEPELVEVELEGKQYKLPPELKDKFMAQSDYTRKTQELAEQRRLLDTQVQLQQQEEQFRQSVAPEMVQLNKLDIQLAQYKGLDWASMDVETMTRTRIAYDQLKEAREDINQTLQGKRQQFDQYRQKVMNEVTQKGHEYLKKHIPNWGSPEIGQQLTKYGLQEGYSDVELGSLTDPRIIKTLWKARQWDELQASKNAPKAAQKAPPPVKVGATKNAQFAENMAYHKAIKSAKTSSEKARIIQERLEKKWA